MIYIYIIISLSVILLASVYYFLYARRSFNLANKRPQVDSNKNKKDKSILKTSDVNNGNGNGNSTSIGLNDNSDDMLNDIADMDSNKKKVSFNKHVFIKYI